MNYKKFLFIQISFELLFLMNPSFTLANPEKPGGTTTVEQHGVQAFSLPLKGITKDQHKDFVVGNSFFRSNWVTAPASVENLQGLGPLFNSRSCSSCHQNDGRGVSPLKDREFVSLLFRLSVQKDQTFMPDEVYGDQLQPEGIQGVDGEGTPWVDYQEIKGSFPDGESFTLMSPTYSIKNPKYGPLPKGLVISPRLGPQIIGLGLLEAITESDVLKNSDPDDLNKDGISGRPNWLYSTDSQNRQIKKLGRFGWKANQASIHDQTAGAFLGDMGITSKDHLKQNCNEKQTTCLSAFKISKLEISEKDLESVTRYVRMLAVPSRREYQENEIKNGEKIFTQVSCHSCHTPSFTTGTVKDIKALSKQKIYPYTDLLIHDMGEGLADGRPDGSADGREWRTPPLWGIGLIKTVNVHRFLLHDGRARDIQEAILWHGGEAEDSKKKFMNLPKQDRKDLIRFVESL